MVYRNRGCLGGYDFEHIVAFARKRFIEGIDTIALMEQAQSEREKEEIALVAMLDLDDSTVRDLQLFCCHADRCKNTNCRSLLRRMIEEDIAASDTNIAASSR